MISKTSSKVTLPPAATSCRTIKDFLILRFPRVSPEVWEHRLAEGKVVDEQGVPVAPDAPFEAGKRIFYFREVAEEPVIPFAEDILFHNDDLLVSCKPHFLPVNPTGPYVAESLMNRLRKRTGNDELVPINRIDRETAGIVLFSANRETRNRYYELFRDGRIEKSYEAIADFHDRDGRREWMVENRMVSGEPWFRMTTTPGELNARSLIKVMEARGARARFALHPLTGKTHQLRLHMSGLGFRILNDRYYPILQPETDDDFNNPLQLLAKMVRFVDPVSGAKMEFMSTRKLKWEEQ
jgi:tRNA pseudouridine32 synthase / 23S rRNA pseudouridine746 synthase